MTWLWDKNCFITSTVISYLVNDNFFGRPSCWILVESSMLLYYLNSLEFPFQDIDPKIKPEKGQKVSKKLADLAWTRNSHLYK